MIICSNINVAFLDSLNYVLENGFEPMDKEIRLETPILIKIKNISKLNLEQEFANFQKFLLPIYPDFIDQYNFERKFYETELFEKLEFINKNIKLKLDSRKLFFNFWKIDDQNPETKSPCLTSIYFRQNLDQSLDMHAQLRANNAVRISPINMLIFIEFFQKVAQKLNLKAGNYYHHSNSYHIYQKDWELANKIISQSNKTFQTSKIL